MLSPGVVLVNIFLIGGAFALKITPKMLPKFRYHCDPSDPETSSGCTGKSKFGFKEGFGFQKEIKSNDIFCLKFNMCSNYAYGSMMLAMRQAWISSGAVQAPTRDYPRDKIAALVKSWYNYPNTIKTIKQQRQEKEDEAAAEASDSASSSGAGDERKVLRDAPPGSVEDESSEAIHVRSSPSMLMDSIKERIITWRDYHRSA
ncbi:unnamed protein product [Nippostrongylus brasiliensis]|uniref:DUF4408 domain-containing protein n=1 Tax=Nippostrongylus brasiliensis TaxID=27835 RepID=A0A0N4XUA7_NIPBR|nr:unnamed protein product [Nippostrongylus brasiliensis]